MIISGFTGRLTAVHVHHVLACFYSLCSVMILLLVLTTKSYSAALNIKYSNNKMNFFFFFQRKKKDFFLGGVIDNLITSGKRRPLFRPSALVANLPGLLLVKRNVVAA